MSLNPGNAKCGGTRSKKNNLISSKEAFGLIPNVEDVMAQAPTLLTSYMVGWHQFNQNSLSLK
ncbi:hypothetical protein MT390_05825 [Vibrio sp. 2-Bac 85]